MFRTDTGNFNRFLTSLGLLMLLGALLVPYFYFGDTNTLQIPAQKLKSLTPVAQEALEARQRRNHDLENWILGLSVLLALGGIAALLFGGRRLRSAQKKEDAAIDRKAKRDDVEIQQMSQSEVEEKREEQARESVQEEDRRPGEETPPPPRTGTTRRVPSPDPEGSAARLRDSRRAIERIEEAVRDALKSSEFDSYEFLYEVKTVSGRQQVRMDGLFRAKKPGRADVILELKVMRQSRMIRVRLRNFADAVLALITRYGQMVPRQATGWLVIVVPEEAEPIALEDRRRLEDQANDSLVTVAKATVSEEREIPQLASKFVELFESQAK